MDTKFKSDDWVEFVAGFRAPAGRFRVIREQPTENDELTYRIKGETEAFERIAHASQLRALGGKGPAWN